MPSDLTRTYQEQMKRTRQATSDAVRRTWKALPAYNEANVAPFVHKVLPIVNAGQQRAVALSSAYMAKFLKVPTVGLNASKYTGAALYKDTTPKELYRTPFIATWGSLSDENDYQDSVDMGENRASAVSEMDVALAASAALYAYGQMSDSFIIGWVRVADNGACKFCMDVDGAHTGPDQPAPLHDNCGCSVEPITGHSV